MSELAEGAGRARVRARLLLIASETVRCSSSGAEPRPSEYGTTIGLRIAEEARSPSTIALSNGPRTPAASRPESRDSAPASPPLPPLVETSTIVRWVSRVANTRASSSSEAVAESSPRAPAPAASRWATITIGVAVVEPGRSAITVSRRRSPSIVCPEVWSTWTVNPPPAVPPSPRRAEAT